MQLRTLLALVVLVLLLGVGVYLSRETEIRVEEPLFDGVQAVDVTSIRVDNLERNVTIRFDRQPNGLWDIVDPIEAAADEAILGFLLEIIETDRAIPVPGSPSAEALGLDPPRLVLDVTERDGTEHRVEIGSVDIAKDKVNVFTRGMFLRTPRRLDNTLLRDLHGYRRPYAFELRPDQVVEVHRLGEGLGFADHRYGFELHALLENDGWRLVAPFTAALNPGAAGIFVGSGARFRIEGYIEGKDLDPGLFGLVPPAMQFELVDHSAKTHSLLVGAKNEQSFACQQGENSELFRARASEVAGLTIPIELLLDRRLVRAPIELIEEIRIEREEGQRLTLLRDGESFSVTSGDGGPQRADQRLTQQFLTGLENVLFYDFLEVGKFEVDSRESEVRSRIQFFGAGEQWDCLFGAEFVDEEGTPCVRVQRGGDDIVACLKLEDMELLATTADELRDHQLARIDELEVTGLELSSAAGKRRYARGDKGEWTRAGETAESFEIIKWIDPLLNLRAERFLDSARAEDAEFLVASKAPIEVRVLLRDGEPFTFVLDGPEGSEAPGAWTRAERDGATALLLVPDLHFELGRVLGS